MFKFKLYKLVTLGTHEIINEQVYLKKIQKLKKIKNHNIKQRGSLMLFWGLRITLVEKPEKIDQRNIFLNKDLKDKIKWLPSVAALKKTRKYFKLHWRLKKRKKIKQLRSEKTLKSLIQEKIPVNFAKTAAPKLKLSKCTQLITILQKPFERFNCFSKNKIKYEKKLRTSGEYRKRIKKSKKFGESFTNIVGTTGVKLNLKIKKQVIREINKSIKKVVARRFIKKAILKKLWVNIVKLGGQKITMRDKYLCYFKKKNFRNRMGVVKFSKNKQYRETQYQGILQKQIYSIRKRLQDNIKFELKKLIESTKDSKIKNLIALFDSAIREKTLFKNLLEDLNKNKKLNYLSKVILRADYLKFKQDVVITFLRTLTKRTGKKKQIQFKIPTNLDYVYIEKLVANSVWYLNELRSA